MVDTFCDINNIAPLLEWHMDQYRNNFVIIDSVASELLWENKVESGPIFFSLIIPTYARSDRLKEALLSVAQQRKHSSEWEIIIVDNTQVNNICELYGLKILKELGDSFSGLSVRYYHNASNIGPGYNWNRGVQLARGKWVTFLHDDDILFPFAFRRIEELTLRDGIYNKPLGYIHARRVLFERKYNAIDIYKASRRMCVPLTRLGTRIVGFTETGSPSCGTTILKKAYMECGGIDNTYGVVGDVVLGYQIMKNYTVICSDLALGAYRTIGNESSNQTTIQLLLDADDIFQRARNKNDLTGRIWEYFFGSVQRRRDYAIKTGTMNIYLKNRKLIDYIYDSVRITYRFGVILYATNMELKYHMSGRILKHANGK